MRTRLITLVTMIFTGNIMAQDRPVIEVGAPIDQICAAYDCYDPGQTVAEPNRFVADTVKIKLDGIEYQIRMDETNTTIDEIRTYDPAFETSKGVKIGSTYQALKAAYPDHTISFIPNWYLIAITDAGHFLFVFRTDSKIQDQDIAYAVNFRTIEKNSQQ